MQSITSLSHLITITVLTAVIFSVLHAKDVSAAATLFTPAAIGSYQPVRGFDNPIHLDLHTHVERSNLSGLLQNIQNDKPLTGDRHLRKAYNIADKKQLKLRDGVFGNHVPSLV